MARITAIKLPDNTVADIGLTEGNSASGTAVARSAAGTIQTEKLAVSSSTTTKATMQYNTTDECVEFVFS